MYQYIFNIAQLNIVIHTPVPINFQSCMEPFRMELEKVEPIQVVYQIVDLWEEYENDSECNKKDFAVKKINDTLSMFPFKWKLIGTSTPETGATSNNTFKQTVSNPAVVYVTEATTPEVIP